VFAVVTVPLAEAPRERPPGDTSARREANPDARRDLLTVPTPAVR